MTFKRTKNICGKVFIIVLFLSCLIFFGFFYRYHIFFIEQLQIFLLTFDHFLNYFSKPAFLSSYLGDFFTQFYYLIGGGSVVVTISLGMLWLTISRLLSKINRNNSLFFLSAIPVVFSWIALCNIEFPVSNIISLIISVGCALIYISIRSSRARFLSGIIMLPLLYVAAGSNFYLLTVIAVYYEIFYTRNPGKFLYSFLLCTITVFVPFALKNNYLVTTGQAYTYLSEMSRNPGFKHFLPLISLIITGIIAGLPFEKLKLEVNSSLSFLIKSIVIIALLVTGIRLNADFTLEKILRLDYEASHNRWSEVYDLSGKYKMHNNISAYYTNMSLSKLGLMPDSLLEHYQPAATGLFIPVNANENYMTITFSNEVYWQLGDINASQHSALLGMIFSPRARNVRLMKRLIEINIVNGEYAVAGKYITILEKTMFYRKWASDRRKFLFNEKECAGSNWIAAKRAIIPSKDLLKKGNEYVKTLRMLADNHAGNTMAVDYLLCYHLLTKDISSFVKDFKKYYSTDRNIILPGVYQEGLLIRISSGEDSYKEYDKFRFSPDIVKNMTEYTRIYAENKGNGAFLKKKFGTTYWFYYHFATLTSEKFY
jgi:Family of unknown function (DUF6057)